MANLESGSPLYYKIVLTVTSKGFTPQTGKYNVNLIDANGQNNNNVGVISMYGSTNLQLSDLSKADSDEFEISKNYEIKFYPQ